MSHLPWYLSSIVFIFWWNRSPCSSLTSRRFSANQSKWLWRKWTLILILIPRILKFPSMLFTISLQFPKKFLTTSTNDNHAANSTSFMEPLFITQSWKTLTNILKTITIIPVTKKAWIFRVATLFSKQEVHHL